MTGIALELKRRLRAGDWIVMLSALILLVFLFSIYWREAFLGQQAAIMVGGKHWMNVGLYDNQLIAVPGPLGISRLEVADGKVRFVESPCDNKLCIHQGWIQYGGEIAACVPNEVSVQVLSTDPRFDSISF